MSGVTQAGVEMETLSIAPTARNQASSPAVPAPDETSNAVLELGALGYFAKRGMESVVPSEREGVDW